MWPGIRQLLIAANRQTVQKLLIYSYKVHMKIFMYSILKRLK